MLKVRPSSTLAKAVKPANAYTSGQTPHPLSQTSVYLSGPTHIPLAAFNSFTSRTSNPPQLVPTLCNAARLQTSLLLPASAATHRVAILARDNPASTVPNRPPRLPILPSTMCHIEHIHFSCGHPEDTKYTMCELAMSEMNHVTTTTDTAKNYPCAACFARGVEEKAKQTREQQGKGR